MKPIDEQTLQRLEKLQEILANLEMYRPPPPKTKRQKFLEKLAKAKPHLRKQPTERPPSKNFQLAAIKKWFKQLNPDVDYAVIDFESYVSETHYIQENLEALEKAYPTYAWTSAARQFGSVLSIGLRDCEKFILWNIGIHLASHWKQR